MAIFTVGSKCLTASLQNSLLHNTRFTISTCIGPRPTIRTVIHDLKSSAFVNKYISRSLRSTKGQNMRKDKLPFEVDTNLPTDVAIYSYNNDKMFKMISAFGVVQFIFWGNIAYFSYSMPSLVSKGGKNPFSENSWWAMIANVQSKYKTHLAVACLGLGYLALGFAYIYPLRSINRITLLKGGFNLQIRTYSHFAKKKSFTIPLEYISCIQSRALSKGSTLSVKVKGRWFYYILDRKGDFHNTKLFDYAVGLKRDFK